MLICAVRFLEFVVCHTVCLCAQCASVAACSCALQGCRVLGFVSLVPFVLGETRYLRALCACVYAWCVWFLDLSALSAFVFFASICYVCSRASVRASYLSTELAYLYALFASMPALETCL